MGREGIFARSLVSQLGGVLYVEGETAMCLADSHAQGLLGVVGCYNMACSVTKSGRIRSSNNVGQS